MTCSRDRCRTPGARRVRVAGRSYRCERPGLTGQRRPRGRSSKRGPIGLLDTPEEAPAGDETTDPGDGEGEGDGAEGDPLTAHDVEFSLHRHMDDANTTTVAANLRAAVEEVRVVDDHTVEIITRGPQGGLPHILSPHQQEGVIFPRDHLVDEAGDDFDAQSEVLNSDPVGSGPFRLVEHVAGDSILFEKVEDHWRATPAVDRLELHLLPDPSTQVAMLLSGEVDIIPVIGDQVVQLEDGGMEIRTVENAANAALYQWAVAGVGR